MKTQGERIKQLRQELGLTQEKFGEVFGINKQFVSLLEKNKTFLNNEKLVKLGLDYNVNLNWLILGSGDMFINQQPSLNNDELEQRVVEVMKKYGVIEK